MYAKVCYMTNKWANNRAQQEIFNSNIPWIIKRDFALNALSPPLKVNFKVLVLLGTIQISALS